MQRAQKAKKNEFNERCCRGRQGGFLKPLMYVYVYTPYSANSLGFFLVFPRFFLGFRGNFLGFPSKFARETQEITPKTKEKTGENLEKR